MSYGVLCSQEISIHALREEGDKITGFFYDSHHKFLSTPSARRATHQCVLPVKDLLISIHALREEGDELRHRAAGSVLHFYPRPPRGGRPLEKLIKRGLIQFLSTPSARRATYKNNRCICAVAFLSTPSARRATRFR